MARLSFFPSLMEKVFQPAEVGSAWRIPNCRVAPPKSAKEIQDLID
jgi:hypothetical protein